MKLLLIAMMIALPMAATAGGEVQNGDWSFFDRASALLKESQEAVVTSLLLHEETRIASILKEEGVSRETLLSLEEKPRTWLLSKVRSIETPSKQDLIELNPGIRNFFYRMKPVSTVTVQEVFYLNYGAQFSVAEKVSKRAEVARLLLHEVGHLLGLDDQKSASLTRRLLFITDPKADKAQPLRVSPDQISYAEIVARTSELEHAMIRGLIPLAKQFVESELGVRLTETATLEMPVEKIDACQLVDTWKRCKGDFTYRSTTVSQVLRLTAIDGKVYRVPFTTSVVLVMKISKDNHFHIETFSHISSPVEKVGSELYFEILAEDGTRLHKRTMRPTPENTFDLPIFEYTSNYHEERSIIHQIR